MNSILEAAPALLPTAIKLPEAAAVSQRTAEHMEISGRNVRIDVFEPPVSAHSHTVLLLHGTGGLLGDGSLMRRAARNLAAHGCHACIVHYFNTTGTFFATHSNVRDHAADWQAAIVEIAHNYAQVCGEPVGVLGYSLGGFLAVGAAQKTQDIGAIAVLAGGFLDEQELLIPAHLPPLLVLHGAEDARVPLDRADALVRMGRRADALVESVVYPHEGHTFGASAERDAFDRAAEFFAVRLEAGAEH
jgi:carboxymethylenebutenolidase